MNQNGTPQAVRDYAAVLADFGRSGDFTLRGVWEALRYAPTFTLADGRKLRPLTERLFLRRTAAGDGEHFEVVPYEAVCDEPLAAFAPERSWRVDSRERP
jgi:hypothetical protein